MSTEEVKPNIDMKRVASLSAYLSVVFGVLIGLLVWFFVSVGGKT